MATKNCTCTCKGCGVLFKPKKADRLKYCSRSCAFANMKQINNDPIRKEIQAIKRIGRQNHKELLPLNILYEKYLLIKIAKLNKRTYGNLVGEKRHKLCDHCKKLFAFEITMGRYPKYCINCNLIVSKQIKKKHKRTSKAYRRAIEKNVYAEKIDPIKVFERDNWICHICKIKTPKIFRGTYKDNAPELDHIVTLAEKGHHTYNNVACCCRKCNMKKGSKSYGQLFLFGEGASFN